MFKCSFSKHIEINVYVNKIVHGSFLKTILSVQEQTI